MTISKPKITQILRVLKARYPVVETQLTHKSPFQLLTATILSAQCTDNQVNKVTKNLFTKYPEPEDLAAAPLKDIKPIIFSTGFYNNKAKNIKACASALLKEFDGVVPSDIEKLIKLPGVGRKTANVVLSTIFNIPAIVVDTHVLRISNRSGLPSTKKFISESVLVITLVKFRTPLLSIYVYNISADAPAGKKRTNNNNICKYFFI